MDLTGVFNTIAQQFFQADTLSVPGVAGDIPVTRTPMRGLRKAEFFVDGRHLVAIEQNPNTGSAYAQQVRQGNKVVQFKDQATDRYVGVAINGKARMY